MSNTINGVTLRDIKFDRAKSNILLRGGILTRSELVGDNSAEVVLKSVPFAKAQRVTAHVNNIMVNCNNEWVVVKSTVPNWVDLLKKLYEGEEVVPTVVEAKKEYEEPAVVITADPEPVVEAVAAVEAEASVPAVEEAVEAPVEEAVEEVKEEEPVKEVKKESAPKQQIHSSKKKNHH